VEIEAIGNSIKTKTFADRKNQRRNTIAKMKSMKTDIIGEEKNLKIGENIGRKEAYLGSVYGGTVGRSVFSSIISLLYQKY
jgi:hypothetical protein